MNIPLLVQRLTHLKTNKGYGEPEVGLEFEHVYYGKYSLVLNPQQNNFFKKALDKTAQDNDLCDKGLSTDTLVQMLVMDSGKWTPYSEKLRKLKAKDDFELFLEKYKLSETDFEKAMKLYEESHD